MIKKIKMNQKTKLTIILVAEFAAIAILLLLVFFAGKKSYDVTFDLNGGTLISGSVSQRVTQGQDANPPTVVKDGHYLRGWAGSYMSITSSRVIKAIWEYDTTPGIVYSDSENQNFCEIIGCYPDVTGDVYIGAYHNDIQVLGITDNAFKSLDRISSVYLLDGILKIGNEAFYGCSSLEKIDLPSTLVRLGNSAFENCTALKEVNLPEGLLYIGEKAFKNCTSLEKIVLPSTLKEISLSAFEGCTSLSEIVFADGVQELKPDEAEENNGSLNLDDIFGTHGSAKPITITTPSETVEISDYAFYGCTSLTRVVLPSKIEVIRKNAFYGCTSLVEVVIPETLTTIEAGAFGSGNITFLCMMPEAEKPSGWNINGSFTWDYVLPEASDEAEDDGK